MSGKRRRILVVMPQRSWPVGDIRLVFPLQELSRQNPEDWEIEFCAIAEVTCEKINQAQLLILQRLMTTFAWRLCRQLQAIGKPYIYELDDWLFEMPKYLLSARSVQLRNLAKILAGATAITTTNLVMAERLQKFNRPVTVIPNALPPVAKPVEPPEVKKLTLLIASSDVADLTAVTTALKALQDNYDFSLAVVGPAQKVLAQAGLRFTAYEPMPYPEFVKFLQQFADAAGVIVAPEAFFSAAKTPVKFYSYAQAGIPVAASRVSPYLEAIAPGVTGLLADNTVSDWQSALERIVSDCDLRRQMQQNCRNLELPQVAQTAQLWGKLLINLDWSKNSGSLTKLPSVLRWGQLGKLFSLASYVNLFKNVRRFGWREALRRMGK